MPVQQKEGKCTYKNRYASLGIPQNSNSNTKLEFELTLEVPLPKLRVHVLKPIRLSYQCPSKKVLAVASQMPEYGTALFLPRAYQELDDLSLSLSPSLFLCVVSRARSLVATLPCSALLHPPSKVPVAQFIADCSDHFQGGGDPHRNHP
jgi:hypothetical protein